MIRVKKGRLVSAFVGLAAIAVTAAHAAVPPVSAQPAPITKAVTAPVTVKIGDALLEEYHGGNPARRTTIVRDGETAKAGKSAVSGKQHV